MDISDIQGTKPKKDWHNNAKTKETNKIDDIPGTKAVPRHQERKNSAGFTTYDYRDVTQTNFMTKRHVNPLSPTYTIRDEEGLAVQIGDIKGNKPQTLPPKRERGEVNLALKTQDIIGATAGTKGLGVFTEVHVRRDVRPINQTSDIDGAQGGSLKKGTTTNRHLSPLDPQYQFPGHSELIDPSNAFSKSKTDFRGSRTFAPGTTSGSIHATTGLEALKR